MNSRSPVSFALCCPNCGDASTGAISPNSPSPLGAITIHHIAGNTTIAVHDHLFAPKANQAWISHRIDLDRQTNLPAEAFHRLWCISHSANGRKAITIDIANDEQSPNCQVSDHALASLIDLCTNICKCNNTPHLNFAGGATSPQAQHHYLITTKCPNSYLKSKREHIEAEVNKRLQLIGEQPAFHPIGLQATCLRDLPDASVIAKVGPLLTADQKVSGILASVSLAQLILESGYGKSGLTQQANNCFGMKATLSGNTWMGTAWDGEECIKNTQEFENGEYITIAAAFRRYSNVEQSIADHSAYLLGAMNGSNPRYLGLAGCTDYKKAFQIIKAGGYATAPTYVETLCSIVETWDLTRFDLPSEQQTLPL